MTHHFINGQLATDLTVHEAVERIDDQLREIANGERKASKLSLDDLATLIVFVRFTLDSRTQP